VNQWLNLLKSGTSSNLADMGWAAVRVVPPFTRDTTLTSVIDADHEATVRFCDCHRGEAAAEELGTDPVDRFVVNVGTISESPSPSCSPHEDGQVHRRLMAPRWDGGSVVVRVRESRSHGEGIQRVRSASTGMPGGRR